MLRVFGNRMLVMRVMVNALMGNFFYKLCRDFNVYGRDWCMNCDLHRVCLCA